MTDVVEQNKRISELLQDKRRLQQWCSSWKVKATDSKGSRTKAYKEKMMKFPDNGYESRNLRN